MRKYIAWLGVAFIIVIVCGTVAVTIKATQRVAANYPQIQLAEDTASKLDHGSKPSDFQGDTVDLKQSLAPFIVIYDKSGKPLAGTGSLDGSLPAIPINVLRHTDDGTHHVITWAPQTNIRMAAATVSAKDYYVLSARSLREVEKNSDLIYLLMGTGGAVSLMVLASCFFVSQDRKAHGQLHDG